ncbi:MAG: lysozyme inhibitor LprI family protein [Acidiferrobacterales bacterium]
MTASGRKRTLAGNFRYFRLNCLLSTQSGPPLYFYSTTLKDMKVVSRLIVLVLFASAQGVAWSQTPVKCNYEGTQAQLNVCAFRDFNIADVELNRVYKKLMSSLKSESKKVLIDEQRAWLKMRDPQCKMEANSEAEGGSMWPMVYNSCREKLTKARTQQLLKLK